MRLLRLAGEDGSARNGTPISGAAFAVAKAGCNSRRHANAALERAVISPSCRPTPSVAEGRRPALSTIAAAMSRFHNRLSAPEQKSSNY